MADKFTYVKKGYSPEEVERYINELELEVKAYREKDASIANAILSAQLAADEILRKANLAADTIVQNARGISARITENSADQVSTIIDFIRRQKNNLHSFKEAYSDLLSKYILTLDESDIVQAEKKADELESYLQRFLESKTQPKE